MRLPALRLSQMRTWPARIAVGQELHRELVGRAIGLPIELGHHELSVAVDTLAVFLDLPIRTIPSVEWRVESIDEPSLIIVTRSCRRMPAAISGSVLICALERTIGMRTLDMPPELLWLRDAIIDCLGRHFSVQLPPLHRLRDFAGWMYRMSDSPATALAAVDSAAHALLRNPAITDDELYTAGLGAAISGLLVHAEPVIAEWAMAFALARWQPLARQLVSTDAACLGEHIAQGRALNAGLLTHIAADDDDPVRSQPTVLDLRRPLAALTDLEQAPSAPSLELLAAAFSADARSDRIAEPVRAVIDRVLQPVEIPAILRGPRPPEHVIGRDELLARLLALLSPGNDVPVCVLWGLAGIGKTTIAAELGRLVRGRQQLIWLSLAPDPLLAFERVARALHMATPAFAYEDEDEMQSWLSGVLERLRAVPYLIVMDDVDGIDEDDLIQLIPAGGGRCAVLVLSRTSLPGVQRACDAVAIHVPGLDAPAALQSLGMEQNEQNLSVIEGLEGHPLALRLAAQRLQEGATGAFIDNMDWTDEQNVLNTLIGEALDRLDSHEHEVVDTLSVCNDGVGVPVSLLESLIDGDVQDALDSLARRSLLMLDGRYVRLHGLVYRYLSEREHDSAKWRARVRRHAIEVQRLFEQAEDQRDTQVMDDLYGEVLLAVARVAEREQWSTDMLDDDHLSACIQATACLINYPRGSRPTNLAVAIQALDTLIFIAKELQAPYLRALLNLGLGMAILSWPLDDSRERIEQARDAFDIALSLLSPSENPAAWARAKMGKGLALREMPSVDEPESLRAAITELEQAAQVLAAIDPVIDPVADDELELWAEVQRNLATTTARLGLLGDAQARERALAMFEDLSNKLVQVDDMQEELALTLHDLCVILIDYADQVAAATDDETTRTRYLDRARQALSFVERVWTHDEHPQRWASIEFEWGRLLRRVPDDSGETLVRARGRLESSLSVYTQQEFPSEWARVQHELGEVFTLLPIGDRAANLNRAITSFEAALQVFSAESYIEQHQKTQRVLEDALASLRDTVK